MIAMAVLGAVTGILVPRLRRRAQRDLYGEGVFDMNVCSLGPSQHGLSQAWGSAAGAVISDEGDLRWRGTVLAEGRLQSPEPRQPHGRELVWLDPWAQVWTVIFNDGSRVELAVAPGDAHHLGPWQQPGSR
ncbi:hypothetical protein [Kineococcus mangrovi]|uniref:hypothetical protein n=1 Tax=Kineococcus mangrovi TaxID=1660183 RepID=UPI003D7E078F